MARRQVPRCSQCGTELPEGSRKSRRYCSAACRTRAWRWSRWRERQWATNVQFALAIREGRAYTEPKQKCPQCGCTWRTGESAHPLNRKRSDSVYCSPKCRTAAWRERRSRSTGVTG